MSNVLWAGFPFMFEIMNLRLLQNYIYVMTSLRHEFWQDKMSRILWLDVQRWSSFVPLGVRMKGMICC